MTCDFSLAHYRELIRAAEAGDYRFAFFDDEPRKGDLLLRHDVDLSLEAAVEMARAEAELGAQATYFLMTGSALPACLQAGCSMLQPNMPPRSSPRARMRWPTASCFCCDG